MVCLFAIVVVSFLGMTLPKSEHLSRRMACRVSLTRT